MKAFLFILSISLITFQGSPKYLKNYFPNGRTKLEGWMANNEKSGYWFQYFNNGQVMVEGNYVSNQKDGWWKYYNSKGQLIKIGKFDEGVKDYYWKTYTNNKITSEQEWDDGENQNEIRFFYSKPQAGKFEILVNEKPYKEGTFTFNTKDSKYFFYNKKKKLIYSGIKK